MNKVILVDTSMLFVPTVKIINRIRKQDAEQNTHSYVMTACSMYFNSLISCLKKIGVNKDDIIIMALEGHSFRKKMYAPYKAQRQGLRNKDTFVNWQEEYQKFNKFNGLLNSATNWNFIRVEDGLEADDIIAISCRYFKDKECIIITGDKDIYMLAYYSNIKIFSTTKKCKGTKGFYINVEKPLQILAEKAIKGDISDNLIASLTDTKEDFELRYDLVNLLKLPDEIEKKGVEAIEKSLQINKELNLNKLSEKQRDRFLTIYDKKYQITEEYCYALETKRIQRKKKEKNEKNN